MCGTCFALTDKTPLQVVQRPKRRRNGPWWVVVVLASVALVATQHRSSMTDLRSRVSCPAHAPATIILIRHCDKNHSRRHCSKKGLRRAEWLPSLFGPGRRFPSPFALFARAPERKHYVLRSIETLEPLSNATGVPIDQSYGARTVKKLIKHLLGLVEAGDLCGRLALVAWKHDQIPLIVRRLGYYPRAHKKRKRWQWHKHDFDTLVVINISTRVDGLVTSEHFAR